MMKRLMILPVIALIAACGPVTPEADPQQATLIAQNEIIANNQATLIAQGTGAGGNTSQPPTATPEPTTAAAASATPLPSATPVPLTVEPAGIDVDPDLVRVVEEAGITFDIQKVESIPGSDNPLVLHPGEATNPNNNINYTAYPIELDVSNLAISFDMALADQAIGCTVTARNLTDGSYLSLNFGRSGTVGFVTGSIHVTNGVFQQPFLPQINISSLKVQGPNHIVFVANDTDLFLYVNGEEVEVPTSPIHTQSGIWSLVAWGTTDLSAAPCVFENVQWVVLE